jgi:serine/threonine protein kinase
MNSKNKSKHASLGNYALLKTLGSGYNSKVKLGYNAESNKYTAVKIIKHSHPSLNLKTLKKEIEVLSTLQHPNVVNLIDFNESIDYVKKNNKTYKVVAIIMELVPNGELFEYVADSGRFSEDVARTYFQVLIETLEYCYNQGFAHRDLKPENLLFDGDFNLKVADFGFATLLSGKDNSGQLHTVLGTEAYMAPEIHLRQPYSGPAVDLFAAAIILFIMVSGTPPFAKADPKNDPHYKLLCINRHETFWTAHEKSKKPKSETQGFYSSEFKDLMNAMLGLDPAIRLTLPEIKAHPWYNGPVCDPNQLKKEFGQRKMKVDAEIEKQKQAKEQEKLNAKMQTNNYLPNAYTGIRPHRDFELEVEGSIKKQLETHLDYNAKRELRDHQVAAGYRARTNYYTVMSADFMFKYLCCLAQSSFNQVSFSNDTYKLKGKVLKEEEKGSCNLTIEITKVDDSTCCVEFHKTDGLITTFYEVVEEIKSKFPTVECEDEVEKKTETKEPVESN